MTLAEIQKTYWDKLAAIYDSREARALTKIVFEKVFELQAHKLSLERFRIVSYNQRTQLEEILNRLLTYEPVQYVLNEADFYGFKFKVNASVLIPRPETEELIEWIQEEVKGADVSLLDIGTGSGCIPVTLAKQNPLALIDAVDISAAALAVAEENNRLHHTNVKFSQLDILTGTLPTDKYDIVVSNPPYILPSEKAGMEPNVLKYEPHMALFTPHDDALIFYRVICNKALAALKTGGKLFFEINTANGTRVVELMVNAGYKNVALRKDLSGKDRMVMGEK